jgi:hypothetical protein
MNKSNITIAALVAAITGVNAVNIRQEEAEIDPLFQGADSAATEADIFGVEVGEADLDDVFAEVDSNEDKPEAGVFAQV